VPVESKIVISSAEVRPQPLMRKGWIANVRIVDVAAGRSSEPRHVRISHGAISDISLLLSQGASPVLDGEAQCSPPGDLA
jgi:hypothetical protein